MTETVGAALSRIRARSGMSLAKIAEAGGFKGPSSIQRYFNDHYNPEALPTGIARKLAKALAGQGDPPVDVREITNLSDMMIEVAETLSPALTTSAPGDTISCFASFIADGQSDPRESPGPLRMGDKAIRTFRKPTHLKGRDISAFFMEGPSMAPRIRAGEIVLYETGKPAAPLSDVVIFLMESDGVEGLFLPAQLIERHREHTIVADGAGDRFFISTQFIKGIAPVLNTAELLEPVFR